MMMIVLLTCQMLLACGGGGGGSSNGNDGSPNGGSTPAPTSSNLARFEYICNIEGADATLIMNVEAVGGTGVVYGSGPNPDITAVIGTGSYTYLSSGDLRSDVAYYIFTGENQFADFTNMGNNERFRVQWMFDGDNLVMLVNPFGPGPVSYSCVLQDARYI